MSASEPDKTVFAAGGIKVTRRGAATISSLLLLVPGGGQYLLNATGVLDPSGSAHKAAGQLAANVHLIKLYDAQIADLKFERDLCTDRLHDCHTEVASSTGIPDSAWEAYE